MERQMDGDGIRVNQLPTPVEPVLPKPAPKSLRYAVTIHGGRRFAFYHFLHVVFFSATTSTGNGNRYGNQRE